MGRSRSELLRFELYRTVELNRGETFTQSRILPLLNQQGLDSGRRHVVDPAQQFFDGPELRDQFDRGFLSDPFHAGNIVARVAHQAHDLDDPCRLDPESFLRVGFAKPFIFHGIVDTCRAES